jgi:predicted membrane protein
MESNMQNRGQLIFGGFLILFGVMFLISNLFDIDFGALCWPTLIIAIGVWLILRPRMVSDEIDLRMWIFGDHYRRGEWLARDQENWSFIGDINLDFSDAEFENPETMLKIYSFIADIDVTVPADLGLSVNWFGFVTDGRIHEKRLGGFASPVHYTSDGYDAAEKKLKLEIFSFVGDLKVHPLKQA